MTANIVLVDYTRYEQTNTSDTIHINQRTVLPTAYDGQLLRKVVLGFLGTHSSFKSEDTLRSHLIQITIYSSIIFTCELRMVVNTTMFIMQTLALQG